MADRAAARYIPLECGHYTSSELELLFRVFGDGTQVHCERCGEFKDIQVKKEKRSIPDQPMF